MFPRAKATVSVGRGRRIRTGTVSVIGGTIYAPDLPFGGFKDRGIGRQNGIAGSTRTSR